MFRKFIISPVMTQEKILRLIDREIQKSTSKLPGRIIAKMNALVDTKSSASSTRLHVRRSHRSLGQGYLLPAPGVPGLSENIRVLSILDRSSNIRGFTTFTTRESGDLYRERRLDAAEFQKTG